MSQASLTKERNPQQLRRSYRVLCSTSVCLAVLGAPLFMQGTVAFVRRFSGTATASSASILQGIALLVLSCVPLVLAWLTWRQTQRVLEDLDGNVELPE